MAVQLNLAPNFAEWSLVCKTVASEPGTIMTWLNFMDFWLMALFNEHTVITKVCGQSGNPRAGPAGEALPCIFNGSHNLEANPEGRKLLFGVCTRCAKAVGLNWQHLCIPFLVIYVNLYMGIEVISFTILVTAQMFIAPVKLQSLPALSAFHSWKITKKMF